MRKSVLLPVIFSLTSVLALGKAPTKPANFSGHWVLNLNQTKNLPDGLKSYSMTVTQSPQQLKVASSFKGDLRENLQGNAPWPGGGQQPENRYPGGRPMRGGLGSGMGRMGMPGGAPGPMGEGMPAGVGMPGNGQRPGSEHRPLSTGADFRLYPPTATYNLDGRKSAVQLGGPGKITASSKADWAKAGKELKLSLDGGNSGWRSGEISIQDQWRLSKDGQQLLVDRKVSSQRGSASLHMIFDQQPSESQAKK